MSACTTFKFASLFLYSGPHIKCFSTGNQSDGNTGKDSTKLNNFNFSKQNGCNNSFVCGASAEYMEHLFSKWIHDSNSVHTTWQLYFSDILRSSDNVHKKYATKEFLETKQKLDNPTESTADDVTQKPPLQGSDYVLGHVILNPRKEENSTCIDASDELIQHISKRKIRLSNKKHKGTCNKNKAEHLEVMKMVTAALEKEPLRTRRDYIKKQLKLIEKKKLRKSLEFKKGSDTSFLENRKPREKPQK